MCELCCLSKSCMASRRKLLATVSLLEIVDIRRPARSERSVRELLKLDFPFAYHDRSPVCSLHEDSDGLTNCRWLEVASSSAVLQRCPPSMHMENSLANHVLNGQPQSRTCIAASARTSALGRTTDVAAHQILPSSAKSENGRYDLEKWTAFSSRLVFRPEPQCSIRPYDEQSSRA